MGSGLILLGIVGAWLAVLVPMALRSHQAGRAFRSPDRFGDAMRVLARREQQGRGVPRSVVVPGRPAAARVTSPAASAAARRLRVLLSLVALAVLTLILGVLGPGWLLLVHLLVDAATAGYVVHLRSLAVRRAERSIRAAERPRRERPRPVPIAGIPDRMPPRAAPVEVVPAGQAGPVATRAIEPEPVAGPTWTAPPVPVPTYVTAPVAPPRVLDLTTPGQWSAAAELDAVERELRAEAGEPPDELSRVLDEEIDGIIEPRRASGDW